MFKYTPIEMVKEYWNNRPCNINHSDKPKLSMAFFDEVEKRKYTVEPHIPGFADFNRWKGKKVLEIGCGIGTDTMMFAKAGANVTAIDYSEKSIRVAKFRADLYKLNNVKFHCVNVERLSREIPIEEYDLIYSFGVLHHTPNPDMAVSELKKFMGPDSELKIMVYHRNSTKVISLRAAHPLWSVDDAVAKQSEAQTGCPVTYSFTKKTVTNLLCGFNITNTFVDHIFPYIVPLYKEYIYKKVWYYRMLPKPLFRLLEQKFGWHLCITARL